MEKKIAMFFLNRQVCHLKKRAAGKCASHQQVFELNSLHFRFWRQCVCFLLCPSTLIIIIITLQQSFNRASKKYKYSLWKSQRNPKVFEKIASAVCQVIIYKFKYLIRFESRFHTWKPVFGHFLGPPSWQISGSGIYKCVTRLSPEIAVISCWERWRIVVAVFVYPEIMNTSSSNSEGAGDKRQPDTTQSAGHTLTTLQNVHRIQTIQNIVQGNVQTIQPSQSVVSTVASAIVGKSISLDLNPKLSLMKSVVQTGASDASKITTTVSIIHFPFEFKL